MAHKKGGGSSRNGRDSSASTSTEWLIDESGEISRCSTTTTSASHYQPFKRCVLSKRSEGSPAFVAPRTDGERRWTFVVNHSDSDAVLDLTGHDLVCDEPFGGRVPAGGVAVVRR